MASLINSIGYKRRSSLRSNGQHSALSTTNSFHHLNTVSACRYTYGRHFHRLQHRDRRVAFENHAPVKWFTHTITMCSTQLVNRASQ